MAQFHPFPISEARAVESLQNHKEHPNGTVGTARETTRKRRLHGPFESKEAAAAHRIKMTGDDGNHDKILYLNLISTCSSIVLELLPSEMPCAHLADYSSPVRSSI